MKSKVRAEHLSRSAVVYVRQSSLAQVLEHRQSTERQYDLATRAAQLGWDKRQVQIVDEDLGQSGASAAGRSGFQRLAGDVSLERVGAIFALEISRLARSSADWHRLLDLCALSRTLIVDDDGIYDPNEFNDRLVLGMKGTMSDAERHVMRLRLQGGRMHKAQKGTLIYLAPTGYVFDDRGALFLDPDERVREAVELLFARFKLDGRANAVVRYFNDNGLLFPFRRYRKDMPSEIVWRPLTSPRALRVFHCPTYAGAYVYGRTRERQHLVDGTPRRRLEKLPSADWSVLIRDSHPAYISWEEHLKNVKRLSDNCFSKGSATRGAAKNGDALLAGLALCGRCGRRMRARYHGDSFTYVCRRLPEPTCWTTVATHIDEEVTMIFLEAIAPPEIDMSLAVVHEVERQVAQVDKQWRLRLERARYEAERMERQYNAVEPENRIVARTLETRWNEKLRELEHVEREYEEARRAQRLNLTPDDKRAIIVLARDLKKIWRAPTTTAADRKQLLRLLIEDIALAPMDRPARTTKIKILWKTGAITEATVNRPTATDANRTETTIVDKMRELAGQGRSDPEIAQDLNELNLRNARDGAFSRQSVQDIRERHGIDRGREPGGGWTNSDRDASGRFSIQGLAARYSVSHQIVRYWIRTKGLSTEQSDRCGSHRITLTQTLDEQLRQLAARSHQRGKM